MRVSLRQTYLLGEIMMFKIFKVLTLSILCILPITAFAKITAGNRDFQVGDTFVCMTDALVSIGVEIWENPTKNGEVVEYRNISFGIALISEDKIDFSDSYPLGIYKGAEDIFPINDVDITGLYYGNNIYFGQLQKVRPTKFLLKAFKIGFHQTVVLQAGCEKL